MYDGCDFWKYYYSIAQNFTETAFEAVAQVHVKWYRNALSNIKNYHTETEHPTASQTILNMTQEEMRSALAGLIEEEHAQTDMQFVDVVRETVQNVCQFATLQIVDILTGERFHLNNGIF